MMLKLPLKFQYNLNRYFENGTKVRAGPQTSMMLFDVHRKWGWFFFLLKISKRTILCRGS